MGSGPYLVIGGTRGTGLEIARLLQQRKYSVRVLARDPDRVRTLLPPDVQIIGGDLTKPETLATAIRGAGHIIFTAGCRSGYPAGEPTVKAVEYEGVLHTLAAAREVGFSGRFLYMTSSGIMSSNLATRCLNLWKGKTLVWRARAEQEIRVSGIDYTIIRAGVLLNSRGGEHAILVSQQPLPLSWRYRIARADVAEVFLAALNVPATSRTTFEVVWADRGNRNDLAAALRALHPSNR